jgi:ubiquinone/menaquinone biosynthesis C-methylase UbiE
MSAVSALYNVEDQQRMSPAKNYFAWQSRLVKREIGTRVIEVGCGIGNFTETILDHEAVLGIDVDAGCVARFRRRFQACPNLGARVCNVANDEFLALCDFRAESCVALNVLEHIKDDRSALGRMARVVRPGGSIVLLVPAFASLYGPIDRNLGHFRRYERRAIRELAQSLNLQVARLSFVNLIGFFGWLINARVLKLQAQSENQIAAFDRWIVPSMSRIEELIPPPLGQSLLVVLRVP